MTDATSDLVGKRIKDNDPRMHNRVLIIIDDLGARVIARIRKEDKWGETRIARTRIHFDGKPRRSGWSVLP